ncbi:nucleotide pyrophosphatase [Halobacteriales archaeon QS_4_69_225]|nr:MAG: nucleotide pyrophosphatase [Halobacteriales archaeon QS_4_69_225]
MASPRTVVVGLDGGHFELIQPWINDGKLPNIERAIETGISADLNSVLPPVTSPNWKSYATGKNPGKLGIFWWENIDVENERVYYPTERKNDHTEFWELIGEKESAGIVGVPTTYPPKPVDGFVISGAPDGENSDYTHPESLESELEESFDYAVTKRNRLSVNREAAVEEILKLIDSRFRVAKELADEHDVAFLQVTTFYLNSLHHFLWDNEATLEGWQIADEHLGDFLDEDCNLVLMSDHGSTEIETVFNINTWLEREGYLTLSTGIANYLYRAGITTDRLIRLAYFLGIPRLAERVVPERLLRLIPDEHGELRREAKTDSVDWRRSDALASGQGPVYLTIDTDENRYEQIRSEIISQLQQFRDPSGHPVADRVLPGEEVYSGRYLGQAPDIVINQSDGIHIAGSIGRDDIFSTPRNDEWRAENKRQGMFVASGPDFSNTVPDQLSILDLAPMMLHLHGCAVPRDMDGCVPKAVFAGGTPPAERDIEFRSQSKKAGERQRIRTIARHSSL